MQRVSHLDEQLPLGVVASSNGIVQVLSSVAVVAASHCDGLILQQVLHACTGIQLQTSGFSACSPSKYSG